jgi:NAD(P)-dependent dehydrogenase (short-subunit alcohol dehydrogenase family)
MLKGKTAVITGGGGVLCSVFAKALAEKGVKIAVLDLNLEAAQAVAKQTGGIAVQANVLEYESLEAAKKIVSEKLGTCDILINGAGGNSPKGTTTKDYFEVDDLKDNSIKTFFDLDQKGIEFVFNLNFLGALMTTQVFAKDMPGKKDAVIINISSMNAFTPLTRIPAYSGAKAAVSNFTQWLAVHFSKVGIRVNAIAPGFFLTEQNRSLLTNLGMSFFEEQPKEPVQKVNPLYSLSTSFKNLSRLSSHVIILGSPNMGYGGSSG